MKLKQLESILGDLQQFPNPKVELEQYPTGAHIASCMLQRIRLAMWAIRWWQILVLDVVH